MSNYIALGEVQILLGETFISNDLHLPNETFRRLVNELNLEVEVENRGGCSKYPFGYKANLNGFSISMISEHEYLFD